jgi:hypothetical protein
MRQRTTTIGKEKNRYCGNTRPLMSVGWRNVDSEGASFSVLLNRREHQWRAAESVLRYQIVVMHIHLAACIQYLLAISRAARRSTSFHNQTSSFPLTTCSSSSTFPPLNPNPGTLLLKSRLLQTTLTLLNAIARLAQTGSSLTCVTPLSPIPIPPSIATPL